MDKSENIAFWLRDGRVSAGMNVKIWDPTDTIAVLVRSSEPVDPARLVNPERPLGEVCADTTIGAHS